ncbi:hypothetical protein PUNSTDRAFT_52912, partial [Punctularia strigosozonata HHB-11173 SS5]|uniref:uncharacterized protein n=1 Tax=Punctularia strigosozonata (strain HHB-11173) TaxID=741275 RepID=UPI0004417F94
MRDHWETDVEAERGARNGADTSVWAWCGISRRLSERPMEREVRVRGGTSWNGMQRRCSKRLGGVQAVCHDEWHCKSGVVRVFRHVQVDPGLRGMAPETTEATELDAEIVYAMVRSARDLAHRLNPFTFYSMIFDVTKVLFSFHRWFPLRNHDHGRPRAPSAESMYDLRSVFMHSLAPSRDR